jgi:phosphotransferase system HPr-like phosphotransfer protein
MKIVKTISTFDKEAAAQRQQAIELLKTVGVKFLLIAERGSEIDYSCCGYTDEQVVYKLESLKTAILLCS